LIVGISNDMLIRSGWMVSYSPYMNLLDSTICYMTWLCCWQRHWRRAGSCPE